MVTHTYEIVPTGWVAGTEWKGFEPFLLDVPADDHEPVSECRSARRAYFSAMAKLAAEGIDVGEFQVFDWTESFGRGPERDQKGQKVNTYVRNS